MPHFQIDYSQNLESRLDVAGLCRVVRDAAAETGVFPVAGIRVRATAVTHVVMADGNPDHAFLDIFIRLRAGRSMDAKQGAVDAIWGAVHAYCQQVMESSPLSISMEMRELDSDFSPKASSIRQYLPPEFH